MALIELTVGLDANVHLRFAGVRYRVPAELDIGAIVGISTIYAMRREGSLLLHDDISERIAQSVVLLLKLKRRAIAMSARQLFTD